MPDRDGKKTVGDVVREIVLSQGGPAWNPQWIDASEATPMVGGDVLVWVKTMHDDPCFGVASYNEMWGWTEPGDVLFWCTLPVPP